VPKHQVGRSHGASAPLVHVRLPLAVLARLAHARERLEGQTGGKANRGLSARCAIARLLETEAPVGRQTLVSPPRPERDAFSQASLAVGHGRHCVRMHRLRRSLAWSRDRFAPVRRQLAAAYGIA